MLKDILQQCSIDYFEKVYLCTSSRSSGLTWFLYVCLYLLKSNKGLQNQFYDKP